jgi:predicted FMN-binding regulatory protein PaiB
MSGDVTEYVVPLLLATLNGLAAWTLLTVVKVKGKMQVQDEKNIQNDKQHLLHAAEFSKVWSRLQAGSTTLLKQAIELRNIRIEIGKIDGIIKEIQEEREERNRE